MSSQKIRVGDKKEDIRKVSKFLIDNGISISRLNKDKELWTIGYEGNPNWPSDFSKPTREEIDAIDEEESKDKWSELNTEDDTKQDLKIIRYVLARMYKELSPSTNNQKIKRDLNKWIRDGYKNEILEKEEREEVSDNVKQKLSNRFVKKND